MKPPPHVCTSCADCCSIIVDRKHEALFAEEIAASAEKRYLLAAVEKWQQERQYEYMLVLEDRSDLTSVVFMDEQRFAETVAHTFWRLGGAKCLWVLLIDKASNALFQQVLDADNETRSGHPLN